MLFYHTGHRGSVRCTDSQCVGADASVANDCALRALDSNEVDSFWTAATAMACVFAFRMGGGLNWR